jgi:hypothetical protein
VFVAIHSNLKLNNHFVCENVCLFLVCVLQKHHHDIIPHRKILVLGHATVYGGPKPASTILNLIKLNE